MAMESTREAPSSSSSHDWAKNGRPGSCPSAFRLSAVFFHLPKFPGIPVHMSSSRRKTASVVEIKNEPTHEVNTVFLGTLAIPADAEANAVNIKVSRANLKLLANYYFTDGARGIRDYKIVGADPQPMINDVTWCLDIFFTVKFGIQFTAFMDLIQKIVQLEPIEKNKDAENIMFLFEQKTREAEVVFDRYLAMKGNQNSDEYALQEINISIKEGVNGILSVNHGTLRAHLASGRIVESKEVNIDENCTKLAYLLKSQHCAAIKDTILFQLHGASNIKKFHMGIFEAKDLIKISCQSNGAYGHFSLAMKSIISDDNWRVAMQHQEPSSYHRTTAELRCLL